MRQPYHTCGKLSNAFCCGIFYKRDIIISLPVTYFFMKWNDIREKVKNQTDAVNARTEKNTVVNSDTSAMSHLHNNSKKRIWIIAGAIIILAAIIIIWCLQSKKVADYGPATDSGITRQEARDAEGFLSQIPLKPLTAEQRKMIENSSQGLRDSETAATSAPSKKGNQ